MRHFIEVALIFHVLLVCMRRHVDPKNIYLDTFAVAYLSTPEPVITSVAKLEFTIFVAEVLNRAFLISVEFCYQSR